VNRTNSRNQRQLGAKVDFCGVTSGQLARRGHPLDYGSCWRRSLNPKEYFIEVPARLLSTAIIQVRELLPTHGKLIRGTLLETGIRSGLVLGVKMKKAYTAKQGQYLAFIYYYTRIHGRAPTEAEMQQYFQVSPPSVHQMVLTLVARGLIERTPGRARSIRLLIPREELPDLA